MTLPELLRLELPAPGLCDAGRAAIPPRVERLLATPSDVVDEAVEDELRVGPLMVISVLLRPAGETGFLGVVAILEFRVACGYIALGRNNAGIKAWTSNY